MKKQKMRKENVNGKVIAGKIERNGRAAGDQVHGGMRAEECGEWKV